MFLQLVNFLTLYTFSALAESPYGDASCAPFIPNSFADDGGFKLRILNSTLNGDSNVIYSQLYNTTFTALSSPGIQQYYLTDLTFDIPVSVTDEPVTGTLYESEGIKTTLSNFSMVGMTIFVPDETGDYTFSIDDVSDGGAIFIFNDPNMYCCGAMDYQNWLPTTTKVYNIPEDPEHTTSSQTVHLVKGLGYIITYSYINLSGDAVFKPTITLPSGEKVSDLAAYIKTSFTDLACGVGNGTSTIISLGTDVYTTTFSTSISTKIGTAFGVIPYTEYETIYYVLTPAVVSSSSSAVSSSASSFASSSASSAILSSSTPSTIISSTTFSSNTFSKDSSSVMPSSSSSSLLSSTSIWSVTSSSVSKSSSTLKSSSSLGSSGFSSSLEHNSSIIESFSTITSSPQESSISSSDVSALLTSSSNINGFTNSSTIISSTSESDSSSDEDAGNMSRSTYKTIGETSIESAISSADSKITQKSSVADSTSSFLTVYGTSTFTDELGLTKTIIVTCSTTFNEIDSSSRFKSQDVISESSSKNIAENKETTTPVVSYISSNGYGANEQTVSTKITGQAYDNNSKDYDTVSTKESSSLHTAAIQPISSVSSSAVIIQTAPNEASKGAVSLFYSAVAAVLSVFLI
ncbi:hypothetical protein C6P45_000570 [Maudiozyma exigua]|uniref:PA14 domain-containing protein n=1 Tax=Maudiozyma exigua TaxID=34358 RepID=A0A9P7B7K9_MAUEX|nr:hypothetical protein C6P45_000570 [Kazachstania exigua]